MGDAHKDSRVAFVCDERFFWHDTGYGALDVPAGGFVEPGTFGENPATKRRARNLLEVSGLLDRLLQPTPCPATGDELLAFHTREYISRIRALSDGRGGDAGDDSTPFGPGSYEIAALAAGACMGAVDAALDGHIDRAYVLCRPPGHHAMPGSGAGFCIFNNPVLAALRGLERGCTRIAIIDWDAHHGNGTQAAFWSSSEVLFVSVHEDRFYPNDSGLIDERGADDGDGFTVNVPLPSGAGDGAFVSTFRRVVAPLLAEFQPQLVIGSSGLDANYYDPFSHLAVTSDGFRRAMRALIDGIGTAPLVCCHEGGYSEGYVPFCFQALMEVLSGIETGVNDPFTLAIAKHPSRTLQSHEDLVLDAVVEVHGARWRALM